MIIEHFTAIIIALILDRIIGDPHWLPHPVRVMGALIAYFDKQLNNGKHRKIKGMISIILILIIIVTLSYLIVFLSYSINQWFGIIIEGILIFTTIAAKNLKDSAYEVKKPLEENNIQYAREKLSWIVGRDTDKLNEAEIIRGTVETVAENTSDGITAPLFFAFIGGAPLAFLYRTVNTADSMIGNKSEKYIDFGWAAARLDDVLNYIPSRLTGISMIISSIGFNEASFKEKFATLFRDARKHPSPNSGWCEAAVAGILCIQLGGVNYYKGVKSERPTMGQALLPLQTEHIEDTTVIMYRTILVFTIILAIGGLLFDIAITRS
ncbi:adenosylcobinamide-phosphate synthase CbiB [Metabacillus fastidiosus]|uniref:adenosylcobinamide-phosphate synthase CbiB n=1 Tax=Metabacillus fastidiosus TaxID=1458 RepID=UPI003D286A46